MKNIEEVILLFRPLIAKHSGLHIDDIINSDSIRGPELSKIVNGQKVPYQPHENVIVFELNEGRGFDIIETYNEDNKVHSVAPYEISLVIYGDNARTLAKKLKARLLTQKVRGDLNEKGISLSGISEIESSTEMINTTRYIRRDMTIYFITELVFDLVDDYEEIESVEITDTKLLDE